MKMPGWSTLASSSTYTKVKGPPTKRRESPSGQGQSTSSANINPNSPSTTNPFYSDSNTYTNNNYSSDHVNLNTCENENDNGRGDPENPQQMEEVPASATTVTYTFEGVNNMNQVPLPSPFQSAKSIHKSLNNLTSSSSKKTSEKVKIKGNWKEGTNGSNSNTNSNSLVNTTTFSSPSPTDPDFNPEPGSCGGGQRSHKGILFVFFLLIIFETVILGFWARLFDLINTSLPQTFSWLSILPAFGSIYTFNRCQNHTEVQESRGSIMNLNSYSSSSSRCESPDSGSGPGDHSVPYIPILGIILTSLQLLMSLFFLFFQNCRKPFLFYLKQSAFLHGLFFLFAGVFACVFLHRDLGTLKEVMKNEMKYGTNESSRWKSTQIVNECCGINGFSDWIRNAQNLSKTVSDFVPKSCCVNENLCRKLSEEHLEPSKPKTEESAGTENFKATAEDLYWKNGCYDAEYSNVLFYGEFQLLVLFTTFLLSIGFYLLSKRFYSSCKKSRRFEEAKNHRIFIRQGSNYMVFGGQPKERKKKSKDTKSYFIRQNGILIQAKGALASSTSLNENHISLEILNFSRKDKINISREMDRIVLTVTKHGFIRGKAVITAINENSLKRISIVPSAAGILNITI